MSGEGDGVSEGGGVRVRGNDYSVLRPAEDFTPSLRVSVIVPAYDNQDKLDLALAALARQTYPAELTEVVVVDNGSTPPLRLPADRPPHTRLITCDTPAGPRPATPGWPRRAATSCTGSTPTCCSCRAPSRPTCAGTTPRPTSS